MIRKTMRPARQSVAAALLVLGSGTYLQAQTAPAADATKDAAASDDIVVLSPFVVSGEADKGSYTAKETLGGNRVRTELKDLASAISVVTDQFMKDVGVKNNADLLKYTVSTEVGGVSGNFAGVGDGRQVGENAQLLQPSGNTRVRGLTQADNTRDFFFSEIPWDGYNVGRVDIQRGPNAIMFGTGKAGGVVNTSTNPASFKDGNRVEVTFDNEGSRRGILDINKVLLDNELALRFEALSDTTFYRQKPAFNRDERVFGALRYDPAFLKKNGMSTSLRVNFEHGNIMGNRPRSLTPADQITPWFDAMGRKTYDPIADVWNVNGTGANKVTLPGGAPNPNYSAWLGAYGNVYGNVISFFGNGVDTQAGNLTVLEANTYWGLGSNGQRDGGVAGVPFARMVGVSTYTDHKSAIGDPLANWGIYKDTRLMDKDVGLFDFYNNLLDGNNKREWAGFDVFSANLSQTFFDNRVGIEGAYDRQRYDNGQLNGVNQSIFIDINTKYVDGTDNPYVGQAFVQSDNGGSVYKSVRETKRLTAFGEFRSADFFGKNLFTKLFGHHTFTGMLSNERSDSRSLNFLRYAMDQQYAYDVAGNSYTLDSNERNVTMINYLSGNLTGVTSADQVGLGRVRVTTSPVSTPVYYFDSHWNKPTDPAAAGYVDPAAPWTPGALQQGNIQADNPANYVGYGSHPANKIWSYVDGDADKLYNKGLQRYKNLSSRAAIWQGYMLDECLVSTVGYRRDVTKIGYYDPVGARNADHQVTDINFVVPDSAIAKSIDETLSWGLVAHTPKFIANKMPWHTNISLFYNRSRNINPQPADLDMSGAQMPNPNAKTKDYGFVLSTLDDRLSLKINWYETQVYSDRLSSGIFDWWRTSQTATLLMQSAGRIMIKDPANDWQWSAAKTVGSSNPTTQAVFDAGAQAVSDAFTNDPFLHTWMVNWGFANRLNQNINSTADTPAGIQASTDATSKGVEFELNARPTPNWNLTLNVTKSRASQVNVGGALKTWIEKMDALMATSAGDLRQWWAGDTGTIRQMWNNGARAQFNLIKLKEGTNMAEIRPWRVNLVTNYNFSTGFLKAVNVGGAYRWEAPVEVGYPAISDGQGGYTYDIANPYKGPAESHYDVWIGYGKKLTEKIDWRIQLNIRDLFSKKELIPVALNPDGTGAYRIPAQTSWQITNTFSF